MKKTLIIATTFLLIISTLGCSKETKLEGGEKELVSFTDTKLNISTNDLYEKLKDKYGINFLIDMIDTKILDKEFPDSDSINDYVNIQVAQELSLEKTYNADLTIDYSVPDNTNNYELIKRFQHLLHTSQIRNNLGGLSFAEVDTIHFSNKYKNSLELIQQARNLITPAPVNYINAKASGWVD